MWGGYTGPGHKTIIPAEAHAKVTFRLVSDQRPEDVGAAAARLGGGQPPRRHRGRGAHPARRRRAVLQRPRLPVRWPRC